MQYINIFTANIRASECIGSSSATLGAWLRLLAHCCEQENGGRVTGAKNWNERQWGALGIKKREAMSASPLITFEGEDAIVWCYPENSEKSVQAKRAGGKRGGLARSNASSTPSSTPSRKGKEKEMEVNGTEENQKEIPKGEGNENKLPRSEYVSSTGEPSQEEFVAYCETLGVGKKFAEMKYRWKVEKGWGKGDWKFFADQVLEWHKERPAPKGWAQDAQIKAKEL